MVAVNEATSEFARLANDVYAHATAQNVALWLGMGFLSYIIVFVCVSFLSRIGIGYIASFIFTSWATLVFASNAGAWISRHYNYAVSESTYALISKWGVRIEVNATSVLLLANLMAVWCGLSSVAGALRRRASPSSAEQ
eukprot:Opistho-1_new@50186